MKVDVPDIGSGTVKTMEVGPNGQLFDPNEVQTELLRNQAKADPIAKDTRIKELREGAETEAFARQLPLIIARADLVAQVMKARYDAFVRAGFTADQALVLCQPK